MVDDVRVEAKSVVPFNLDSLRRHLSDIIEARSVLDNNLHARQRHLEASVFDLTVEMLQQRPKPWNKKDYLPDDSFMLIFLYFSLLFLGDTSIFPTTWIFEDVHTPFHHI